MNPTIELPATEWKNALTGLSKVISKRTTLPVLEHLRVTRTATGAVTLQVTDLDVTCTYQAAQPNVGEPCDFLVPFAPLHQAVKGSKESVQLIAEKKGSVRLRTFVGTSPMEQSFVSLPVDEFPPATVLTSKPVPLDAIFRDSFRQALDCCSDDASRHVIQHVCLDTRPAEGHYLAATNGTHLFCANSFQFDLKAPVLIPNLPFLRWTKFMEDGAIELSVSPQTGNTGRWAQLKSGPWTLLARSSDLVFPNWKQVVPAAMSPRPRTRVRFDAQAIETLLSGVPRLPGGDELNRPVKLEITGSTLTVKAKDKDAPDWTCLTVAGATITGKPLSISLNRDYLLKALRFGLTTVEIEDDLSPLDFFEGGRRMIVMPVRPSEAQAVPASATPASSNPSPSETPASATPSAPTEETPTAETKPTMPQNPMPPERGTRPVAPVNGETSYAPVIAHLDGVKAKLRDVLTELNEAVTRLKAAEKEQKVSTKEIESVRATLRSLQRVQL